MKNILRIGSRSQFPRLEAISLETYNKTKVIPRLKGTGKPTSQCRAKLESSNAEIQGICHQTKENNAKVVKHYLEKRFPLHEVSIFGDLSKKFETGMDSQIDNALQAWLSGDAPNISSGNHIERSLDELLFMEMWTLSNPERYRLYQHWLASTFVELSQRLYELMHSHCEAKRL